MYILVEHTITDPAKFWAIAQQGLPSLPAHLKLHQCFPAPDGNRAVCVWEANSVREVETHFDDSGLAKVSRNQFYGVENKEGVALPSSQAA
jgi:hypothetical protein